MAVIVNEIIYLHYKTSVTKLNKNNAISAWEPFAGQ